MGVDKGDNGLLYVCLKTWPNKQKTLTLHRQLKIESNMKRATLTFVVTLYGSRTWGVNGFLFWAFAR